MIVSVGFWVLGLGLIVTMRHDTDYSRVLLCSCHTTSTGGGVLLTYRL